MLEHNDQSTIQTEAKHVIIYHSNKRLWIGVSIIVVVLFATVSFISYMGMNYVKHFMKRGEKIENKLVGLEDKFSDNFQTISAGITYDQKRKRILLQLRDHMIKENTEITPAQAFIIADINLKYQEQFKRIDAFTLTAIQKVESNYDVKAISSKGAMGLNQIMPSTGRMLCRIAGWEYSDDVLKDPDKNTYLACIYLDMLYVQHRGDLELMLAEYNGGSASAYYYQNQQAQLNSETKQYIPKVVSIRKSLQEKIQKDL